MYFVVHVWNGKRHHYKTTVPKSHSTPRDFSRIGEEVERYELTEEQSRWSIRELMQACEFQQLTKVST